MQQVFNDYEIQNSSRNEKITSQFQKPRLSDLLKKLRIQFETIGENEGPSGKEVKQSVIDGQLAYKNGEIDQFKKIDRKDLWKKRISTF